MTSSLIVLDADFTLSPIDRRLFGVFVEHLGRCVYTGIFEPGHPTADQNGFRQDVLDLVRELGPTIVRYPGGNFVSGYNWEDGVGPLEQRPTRLDLAWFSTETNRFGTNEFIQWCRLANTEPMLAVNLGTRGPDEARSLVEYCNYPGGTRYSDLRIQHGFKEPHGIKFWCLGNEMDGPWQICQKTALEYGRVAKEAAKVMKWIDPSIVVAACGSSGRSMPTFGPWETEVMEHTLEHADYVSLHMYFENPHGKLIEFLANADLMDRFIKETVALCDAVATKSRSSKRMLLSFDEWNVWYKARRPEHLRQPGWPEAPHLIEETYDLQDALMVGGALITLLNNADRVGAACLAQLVNAIGAIRTEPGGAAWRQTIFHPFKLAAALARGTVLRTATRTPEVETETAGAIPQVLTAAVHDESTQRVVLFALNRDADEPCSLTIELRGFPDIRSGQVAEISGPDLTATNTAEAPDAIRPKEHSEITLSPGLATLRLSPASWSVVTLEY
jgi:alpha-L-arabinofuranosidase